MSRFPVWNQNLKIHNALTLLKIPLLHSAITEDETPAIIKKGLDIENTYDMLI